jgi:hypothetical protein
MAEMIAVFPVGYSSSIDNRKPKTRKPMRKTAFRGASLAAASAFLLLTAIACSAQAPPAAQTSDMQSLYNTLMGLEETKGWTLSTFYGGSFYSGDHVTEWNVTGGYNFNKYFGIDAGIPFYFVAGPGIVENAQGLQEQHLSANGIGDVYADLIFTVADPVVSYLGTVRVTAPTGNTAKGFSTGRVTYDWDNYVQHEFGRFRPFADAGLANSLADNQFFYRPFTTFGTVALFEGGTTFRVVRQLRVGASLYDDLPIGTQRVIDRVSGVQSTGNSSIDRDNGWSGWITYSPISFLMFEAGYDRSVRYGLNVFSFGVGFNIKDAYRRARSSM